MTTYVLGVVGVYRKCRECGEYFRARARYWQRTCNACCAESQRRGGQTPSRAYAITDEGRAYLRELEAEEGASNVS